MEKRIISAANARVRAWRRLRERKARERQGRLLVEGVRLAEEALASGWVPEACLVAGEEALSGRAEALVGACREAGAECFGVSAPVMRALAETVQPQGVLIIVRPPDGSLGGSPEEEALIQEPPDERDAPWLIVDGLRDPGNLGSLLRSAWAFGVRTALLLKGTTDAYAGKALRASMGAAFRLRIRSELDAGQAIRAARSAGRMLCVAVASGGEPPDRSPLDVPLALVIGGEAEGASSGVREAADRLLQVPLADGAESLNAAAAGAVLLYEAARQRRSGDDGGKES